MANAAKQAIKAYLDNRAASDPQFAIAYAKTNKNIDQCFDYILGEARKHGQAVCMTDEDVFGLAVHYYDEDDIKIAQVHGGQVEHTATVQLTEEEKQQARQEAMTRFGEAYVKEQRMRPKKRKAAQEQQEPTQLSTLFDLAAL